MSEKLPPAREIVEVGNHTSIHLSKRNPNHAQIHFQRNLEEIEAETAYGFTRAIVREIIFDLQELAFLCGSDGRLKELEEIIGVAAFPKKIGERLGFTSENLPRSRRVTKRYIDQTPRRSFPDANQDISQLRRFTLTREELMERYFTEDYEEDN